MKDSTMKFIVTVLVLALVPLTGFADEEASVGGNEKNEFPEDYRDVETDPTPGEGIQKYAEDAEEGAARNFGRQPVHDNEIFYTLMGDRLEYRLDDEAESWLWELEAWIGDDYNKLYLESEGVWLPEGNDFEGAEVELFYGRNISSFWDLKAGVRHDLEPDPERTFGAIGLEGMAPYLFEMEATAYVSEDGDVSAVLEGEYDLMLTQRLVFQPRFETSAAWHEVEEYGVGHGVNKVELGGRLRYEFMREFAPYVGFSWERKLGETADMAEEEGEDIEAVRFVAGLRFWL